MRQAKQTQEFHYILAFRYSNCIHARYTEYTMCSVMNKRRNENKNDEEEQ